MKRWTGYILLISLCVCMTSCGKKETGSELLTETKEAVTPVEETVEPAVEKTVEGMAFHIYYGDEQAENIVQDTIYAEEVDEHTLMQELVAALEMDSSAGLKSVSFGMHNGDRVVIVDVNQAFADYVSRMGAAGEYIVIGSLTNTFLDCYQCDAMLLTVEGKVMETSHNVYEEYLEWYPYVESLYSIEKMELGEGDIQISCPQIMDFSDGALQGKWNRIFLGTEERVLDDWEGNGTYQVTFEVKTMTADMLSILMNGTADTGEVHSFQYTYNIDLNTGESIRLRDHVDVKKVAENLFAGTGFYVDGMDVSLFSERLKAIYGSPEALARSLEGYDYSEDGSAPYGYSYIEDGKVWLCMEVPHDLGDYVKIELDTLGEM